MSEHNDVLPHVKLHFNLAHPNLEECYSYGYLCAVSEVSHDENPYKANTKEADQWSEGWWAGFYQEDPLFTEEDAVSSPEDTDLTAVNDTFFTEIRESYLTKVLEIASVIAVSAILGYQVLELVA